MSWLFWFFIYAVFGVIFYIVASVIHELECREEGKHMNSADYIDFLIIIPFWPVCAVIAVLALIEAGIVFLCKNIADYIEKSRKKAVTLCKEDDSNKLY